MDNNQPTSLCQQPGDKVENVAPLPPVTASRSALCLSGGGIRSATFSLGVIQGLASLGWLEHFAFLSTVSGGGYIGSWLTAWIHRATLPKVVESLKQSVSGGEESAEIRRLRSYSNYLSPVSGVSGDMLALVSTLLRNLFFSWLVLIPLLCTVIIIPCLLFASPTFSAGALPLFCYRSVTLSVAIVCSVIGIAYATSDLPHRREHQTKNNYFFQWWLLPMTIGCISLSYFLKSEVAAKPIDFINDV